MPTKQIDVPVTINKATGEFDIDLTEHNVEIRRQERERVLKEIDDCATTDGEWFRIDGTDFLYLNYSVLSKKMDSLRGVP